jgi:hypothetical protein
MCNFLNEKNRCRDYFFPGENSKKNLIHFVLTSIKGHIRHFHENQNEWNWNHLLIQDIKLPLSDFKNLQESCSSNKISDDLGFVAKLWFLTQFPN